MSVKLYDNALVAKLKRWSDKTSLTIVGPNEAARAFAIQADKNNDQPIQLPMIVLSRAGGYNILRMGKEPLSFDGLTLDANHDKAMQLNAIPIDIHYQLDIYTRYFEECDNYTRNIVFNIVNYPKLDIVIPYEGQNIHHDANIRMETAVTDNSSIPERLVPGQFTRMTINIYIDDAYLFDVRVRDVYELKIDDIVVENIELT